LTASYFGADSGVMGATGGVENFTMALANLSAHHHAVFLHDPTHSHGFPGGVSVIEYTGATAGGGGTVAGTATVSGTAAASTGVTIGSVNGVANDNLTADAGSASPTPMRTVQPTLVADCVVRVTP
jgi:hypothetical protein